MSWFNIPKNNTISEFLKGTNIFDQLNNSIFGKVKNTLSELFGEKYIKKYKLPNIIVIGNESSGKSSLLENITKCQLFPRDIKMCTKCPIHLRLNNSNTPTYSVIYKNYIKEISDKLDIFSEINNIMDFMDSNTISTDEIVINISEPNLPIFELLDLPGIVSYPPDVAEQSVNLCKKYLTNKNTIVLCVVPATTTRLTSCQSIALIKEMNMEHNSILALTMTDRIQKSNIGDLLINRLLKISDELTDINFYGCIAVVNRIHTDEFTLEENDKHELEWFKKNILNNIPSTCINEFNIISQNITINNLIKQLDTLYSIYIEQKWKPVVINEIKNELANLELIKLSLGVHVNDLKYGNCNVLNELLEKIYIAYVDSCKYMYFSVSDDLYNTFNDINKIDVCDDDLRDNSYKCINQTTQICKHNNNLQTVYSKINVHDHHWNITTTYYNDNNTSFNNVQCKHINGIYELHVNDNQYYKYNILLKIIDEINDTHIIEMLKTSAEKYINECFDNKTPLVLRRFTSLRDVIYKYISDQCLINWHEYRDNFKKYLKCKLELDLMCSKINEEEDYCSEYFESYITNMLKNHVFNKLMHNFNLQISYNDFIENNEHKQQRYDINEKILKFDQHLNIISNI
jgi:GTP-binding protein EngB required for normal cell division